jgi:GTP-dependent phosphoenolpyruvate carboxykinase
MGDYLCILNFCGYKLLDYFKRKVSLKNLTK